MGIGVGEGIPLKREKKVGFSGLARERAIGSSNVETHGIPPTFRG